MADEGMGGCPAAELGFPYTHTDVETWLGMLNIEFSNNHLVDALTLARKSFKEAIDIYESNIAHLDHTLVQKITRLSHHPFVLVPFLKQLEPLGENEFHNPRHVAEFATAAIVWTDSMFTHDYEEDDETGVRTGGVERKKMFDEIYGQSQFKETDEYVQARSELIVAELSDDNLSPDPEAPRDSPQEWLKAQLLSRKQELELQAAVIGTAHDMGLIDPELGRIDHEARGAYMIYQAINTLNDSIPAEYRIQNTRPDMFLDFLYFPIQSTKIDF